MKSMKDMIDKMKREAAEINAAKAEIEKKERIEYEKEKIKLKYQRKREQDKKGSFVTGILKDIFSDPEPKPRKRKKK
jgi:hypothetical protein